MTWKDVKVAVLQRCFAITDGNLIEDDTTREYLTAAPAAANEALELLATAGRFLKRALVIRQGDGEGMREENGETVILQPLGSGWNRYDLSALAPDFYGLNGDGVYFEGDGHYCRPADWTLEAGRVLVLPAGKAGAWRLWYNAYPKEITAETEDGYELPLYPEMAALLPLYIASQVYKDDDIGVAVQYRNEFEVGREALLSGNGRESMGKDYWTSTTGWW